MLETLVQKGQTLDPQTLSAIAPRDGDMGRWDRHQGVGGGLMLMCIGVGLGVFLWALTGGSGLFEGTGMHGRDRDQEGAGHGYGVAGSDHQGPVQGS